MTSLARLLLPQTLRRWAARLRRWPPVGRVRFGSLRRVKPISREWGFDRGRPVDRHYIEGFLAAHAADIRGRVLEVAGNRYTRMFGGDRVERSDVLHVAEGGPNVTIVADLARGDSIPSGTFDCVIVTQTLQCIYDVKAAIGTLHRILKPGGVVLATVPGISKVSREDMDRWGYHWSFTTCSARHLFEEFFEPGDVEVEAHGNVLSAIAFLHGLADRELEPYELEFNDPDYEVVIGVRARKDGGG
jgi:SAM-dependent methyltransferase